MRQAQNLRYGPGVCKYLVVGGFGRGRYEDDGGWRWIRQQRRRHGCETESGSDVGAFCRDIEIITSVQRRRGAPDQRADVLPRIIGVAVPRLLAAGVLDLKNTDFGEVAKGSALGPCCRYGQVERGRLLAKLRPGDYRIVEAPTKEVRE